MKKLASAFGLLFIITVLLIGCSKKPGSVIKDFYGAKTWDEKKTFILDAGGLKENMIYDEVAGYEVKDIVLSKTLPDGSVLYKAIITENKDGKEESLKKQFIVVKSAGLEKIDFKTMISFNPMTPLQFYEGDQKNPAKFWARAESGNNVFTGNKIVDLKISNTNGYIVRVTIPEKNCPEDIKRIYDLGLKNNGEKFQVEILKAGKNFFNDWTVDANNVKFIQMSPITED